MHALYMGAVVGPLRYSTTMVFKDHYGISTATTTLLLNQPKRNTADKHMRNTFDNINYGEQNAPD